MLLVELKEGISLGIQAGVFFILGKISHLYYVTQYK